MDDYIRITQEGPVLPTPNAQGFLRTGSYGEALVSQMWGKYGEFCRRGYVFATSTAAAQVFPLDTASTNSPCLWNPEGSGKLVIPLRLNLSCAVMGAATDFGVTVSQLLNTGAAVAVGLPVATWTNVVPVNLLLGRGTAPTTRSAFAVNTFTVNPARVMDLGIGGTYGSDVGWLNFGHLFCDFDGAPMMPPGTLISLGGSAASVQSYFITIVFAEIPLPAAL